MAGQRTKKGRDLSWKAEIYVSSSQNLQNIAVSTKSTCHFTIYPG